MTPDSPRPCENCARPPKPLNSNQGSHHQWIRKAIIICQLSWTLTETFPSVHFGKGSAIRWFRKGFLTWGVFSWEKWMRSRNYLEQGETMKRSMDIATGGNGCPEVLWRRVYGPEWELKKLHYSRSTVWRARLGRESVIVGSVDPFKYHDLYPNIARKSLKYCKL